MARIVEERLVLRQLNRLAEVRLQSVEKRRLAARLHARELVRRRAYAFECRDVRVRRRFELRERVARSWHENQTERPDVFSAALTGECLRRELAIVHEVLCDARRTRPSEN